MDILENSSDGPSQKSFELLYDLDNFEFDASDRWEPYVAAALRYPTLGDEVFAFVTSTNRSITVVDCDAACDSLFDHAPAGTVSARWEAVAKLLMHHFCDALSFAVLPETINGRMKLLERYVGRIDRLTDSTAIVKYGVGKQAFEAEYILTEFNRGTRIRRGDDIEAAIVLWHREFQSKGIDHLFSEEEQQQLDDGWQSKHGTHIGDIDL